MQKPKFCWDATIFISHLTGEIRTPEETAGLAEVVDLTDSNRAIIITSSLLHTEVIGDSRVIAALNALFRRPNFVQMNVSPEISRAAGRIRDATGLKTPDAIYVATAIEFRVDALHSFDDHHLRLSGAREVGGLVICKPRGVQTLLGL
jgi:predicted nucleic acid-binding protein